MTVGSSATHSVCVCAYHQNLKLMLSALHINDERYFTDKIVGSVNDKASNTMKIIIIIIKQHHLLEMHDRPLRVLPRR